MITETKRKALEALKPNIESGEIRIIEFEGVKGEDKAEELRKMFKFSDVNLADLIHQERHKSI